MFKHILWFIAGLCSVMASMIFMASIFAKFGLPPDSTLAWVVAWLPIWLPGIISILVWRKSPAYAAGVALCVLFSIKALLAK